jgi:hypothetical protein
MQLIDGTNGVGGLLYMVENDESDRPAVSTRCCLVCVAGFGMDICMYCM